MFFHFFNNLNHLKMRSSNPSFILSADFTLIDNFTQLFHRSFRLTAQFFLKRF